MASTTLTASGGTWYANNENSIHYGDTALKTTWLTKKIEDIPRVKAETYYATAILQFTIPSNLKYKRFTNAVLRFYTADVGHGPGTGVILTPYLIGDNLQYLRTNNVETLGIIGESKVSEPFSDYAWDPAFPRWRDISVLEFFSNNLYDGQYFTLMINAWPGICREKGYSSGPAPTDIGGPTSFYPPTLTLTYEDVTQEPPTPTYPADTYVNENTDIMFSWAWNSTTAAVQASVQLEYKLKTDVSYTVVSLTQTTHTYKLTGGLAQGVYQWRIKGTNDASETSGYSDVVEFTVVGKPAAPVINTVPNRTLTEITWNAANQNAFDITLTDANGKVLVSDSIASTASSYKPNLFLSGNYTVGIRTKNSTGLVSDWSYKVFAITAAGPTKPTARLSQNDAQVTIKADTTAGVNYAVIRKVDREGGEEKVLGYLQTGELKDATWGFGIPYRYVVRAWEAGGYTDSDPMRICYKKTAVVLETDEDELILDRSEEKFLPYSEEISGDMAIFNCVGRELPIVEHSDNESRYFKSRLHVKENQMERLIAMSKENKIYYRDYSGRAFPVAINPPLNLSRYMNDGYMADIQFVRISEEEVVVNV